MKKEIWKSVKGFEGCYEISNKGRVKSLVRKKVLKELILKQTIDGKGYYAVKLSLNGIVKTCRVHKLVAIAFLDHIPDGFKEIIDHKDNNKLNNDSDNLQIISVRKNTSKDRKGGTSEYVGVSWNKRAKKWIAYIRIRGKLKHLGYFENEIKASERYQKELNLVG